MFGSIVSERASAHFYIFVYEQIVRRNASLSCVCQLSENNPLSRKLEISILVHDAGAFPPSSRVTGISCFAAASMTTLPTGTLPVKRYSQILPQELLVCLHSPSITDTYSGGKISLIISDITVDTAGASSDGLMTAVFPAASAPIRGETAS